MIKRILQVASLCLLAAACQALPSSGEREPFAEAPQITPSSPTGLSLESLPPPARAIDVALYNFPDLTGQNRPNDTFAEYSRAVTQGGAAFVVDALNRATLSKPAYSVVPAGAYLMQLPALAPLSTPTWSAI